MLLGEYQHSIDEKGRMAVPAKFRKLLSSGVVVTKGLDGCLYLYPMDEWTKLAEKLAALPISQANTRAFARLMLAGAMEAPVDGQGRIMIPDYLRKYASIGKSAVVAGLFNRIEIWDESLWEKYRKETEQESGQIAEQLGSLGV